MGDSASKERRRGQKSTAAAGRSTASSSGYPGSSSGSSPSRGPGQQYHQHPHQPSPGEVDRGKAKKREGKMPSRGPEDWVYPRTKAPMPTTMQGWKDLGKQHFVRDQFELARAAYTNAIALDSGVDVLFTNRALCCLRLDEPDHIEGDARRALALNTRNVKGHYLLGIATTHSGDFATAISSFRRALDLEGPTGALRHEIVARLRRARRREWQASRLEGSLLSAFQREARELLAEKYSGDELGWRLDTFDAISAEYERAMNPDRLADQDVPEAFCCPISFELMVDPVISPASGQSYDRAAITEALSKKQQDPTNRAPLKASQLIPNIALRQAIESFMEANPWCIDPQG